MGYIAHADNVRCLRTFCNRILRTDLPHQAWHVAPMMDQPVTSALRALREEAKVGVREMARRLGMTSPSSYSHYEDPKRFKDKYLPMEWAIRFADALDGSGVDRSRVLALAGTEELMSAAPIDARFQHLSGKRQQVLLNILSDLEAADKVDRAIEEEAPGAEASKP